jgi:hypothetical protein
MTTTDNLREWALYLARLGWRIFPLVPGAQRPAVKDWETRATTDPERITRCWYTRPFNLLTGLRGDTPK